MRLHHDFSDTQELPDIEKTTDFEPDDACDDNLESSTPTHMSKPSVTQQIRRASLQGQYPETKSEQRPQQYKQEKYTGEAPRKKKHKKHKRRKKGCLWWLLTTVIVLVVLIFGLYSGLSVLAIRKIRYDETTHRNLTANMAEEDKKVRNVLLIAADQRGGQENVDIMALLSFSGHNHTTTLTTLMPDSYVSIPNYGTNKLRTAYSFGGATLLMDTIVNNFGIPINDYVCVNFNALMDITDAAGGVRITLTDEEAKAINDILKAELNEIAGDVADSDLLPSGGVFHLSGKQALAYSQIQNDENADFDRSARQEFLLKMLLDGIKKRGAAILPKILQGASFDVSANIPMGRLCLMSLRLPVDLWRNDLNTLRLPADGTFTDQIAPDGQKVLAVDFDANRVLYQMLVTNQKGE